MATLRSDKAGQLPPDLWGQPLRGQGAVVIGGAGGIGLGIAEELIAAGAETLVADVDADALRAAHERLGVPVERVDLTETGSIDALVKSSVAALSSVRILVNSAGLLTVAPVVELPPDDWDRVMAVNARGVYLACRAFLPHMSEQGAGAIVNIASFNAKRGSPGLAHYSASKFAVAGFTQSLAMEVASAGIRVNAVCPGSVRTPMLDALLHVTERSVEEEVADLQLLPFPQTPREIGAAVVFLASMPSITGQALNVDGGCVFD